MYRSKNKPIQFIYISVLLISILNGCNQDTKLSDSVQAQSFTLFDTDSVIHSLRDYDSVLVMVHFWADWCPSCRKEFPKLEQAYKKLKSRGFQLLAINSGQSYNHVLEIKNTYGLSFPLLLDEEAKTAAAYNVRGLPSTFFIDKNGMIRQSMVGWLETEQIIKIVERLNGTG